MFLRRLDLAASLGTFLIATATVCLPCLGQQQPTVQHPRVAPEKTIHEMYLEDQNVDPTKTTQEEYNKTAEVRRKLVRHMLEMGSLTNAQDFHDAAFLFQHGEDPQDYLLAHVLAIEAVLRGDASSKWLVAATLDRYLQLINRPQIFGTQYPLAFDSAAQADHKTNTYKGRTQEPFDPATIPSHVKRDFCIPDLKQQKENLDALNRGTYPDATMVAPGCSR